MRLPEGHAGSMIRVALCKRLEFQLDTAVGGGWNGSGGPEAAPTGTGFQAIEDGDTGRVARKTKQSQSGPIGDWGRRDPGNGPLRLRYMKYETKPISDGDQSGFAPLSTVYDAAAGSNA